MFEKSAEKGGGAGRVKAGGRLPDMPYRKSEN
jgi:hypothetical protein